MWCWDRRLTRSLPEEIELGATDRIKAERSSDLWQNYDTYDKIGQHIKREPEGNAPLMPEGIKYLHSIGIEFGDVIGKGGYGQVWKCVRNQQNIVNKQLAAKKLSIADFWKKGTKNHVG
jgi:hypothetical protein